MIKTTVIPNTNKYAIQLPDTYIGKNIEILVYTVDEVINEEGIPEISKPRKTLGDFVGLFNDA